MQLHVYDLDDYDYKNFFLDSDGVPSICLSTFKGTIYSITTDNYDYYCFKTLDEALAQFWIIKDSQGSLELCKEVYDGKGNSNSTILQSNRR